MSTHKQLTQRYIGLMSGTSIDGIDVAVVEFENNHCHLIASLDHSIPNAIKEQLSNLSSPSIHQQKENRIELMGELDVKIGHLFADAVLEVLQKNNFSAEQIVAVGSHGQTLRHRPTQDYPFTLQIGDPNIIAEKTGITCVADFRRADIVAGGQGAPLAPAFHSAVLHNNEIDRIILNLGGIANITYLPKDKSKSVIGFDTGTANTLLDAWYKHNFPNDESGFDKDAQFAKQGSVNKTLLTKLLSDPYFQLAPPKSTGREYFSLNWLQDKIEISDKNIHPQDIQRTLIEFTTQTIADSIKKLNLDQYQILTCGGGMHNSFLIDSLSQKLNQEVFQTNDFAVDGDYLEAMTFAWLAKQRIVGQTGNLPSVTGANKLKVLGGVYLP